MGFYHLRLTPSQPINLRDGFQSKQRQVYAFLVADSQQAMFHQGLNRRPFRLAILHVNVEHDVFRCHEKTFE